MFESDPICILTAGSDVNGNNISQTLIDEMADSYNTNTYTARIFKEGEKYSGDALGSVLSLEKKGNQLFAILKPNSKLLRSVETGQSLHSACECTEKFAGTGKAYLTGLILTDSPLSLGTTQIHLSNINSGAIPKEALIPKKENQLTALQGRVETLASKVEQLNTSVSNYAKKREEANDGYL